MPRRDEAAERARPHASDDEREAPPARDVLAPSDTTSASAGVQRKVHRQVPPGPVQLERADGAVPGAVVQRDEADAAPPTDAAAVPEGPPPLTKAQCVAAARETEIHFGKRAATSGEALAVAQRMIDGCIAIVIAHVESMKELEQKALNESGLYLAQLAETQRIIENAMGTPATDKKGVSNRKVAGAVAPKAVADHLATGTGNLRTKMTAVVNFMSTMSEIVLKAESDGNEAFFGSYLIQGQGLRQKAVDVAALTVKTKADAEARAARIAVVDALGREGEVEPLAADAKKARKTLFAPAKSEAAQQQESARFSKKLLVPTPAPDDASSPEPVATDDGRAATDREPAKVPAADVPRSAADPSLGPVLHPDELEFMGLQRTELEKQRVTWEEGLDIYVMDKKNQWVAKQLEIGLPIGAGPASGTTDRLVQMGKLLNVEPIDTRAACLGYLLSINAHTLVEIMTSANAYGIPGDIATYGMYRAIAPFGSLEGDCKDERFWNEAVMTSLSFEAAPAKTQPAPAGGQ